MTDLIAFFQQPLGKYYFSAILIAWPVMVICARFGVSRAGALLLAVPYAGFALVCVWLAMVGRQKPAAKEASDGVA